MNDESPRQFQPINPSERLFSLDVLRGFAVLGILIMNIQSFSMIAMAYKNPTAFGDFTDLNRWAWIFSHLVADRKFMPLFAMLFGAGILLFTERIQARGGRPAARHYTRMLWLMVFGLVHAYAFWYGDILFTYGLVALWVYLFRNMTPRKLGLFGLGFMVVPPLLAAFFQWSMAFWPPEALAEMQKAWMPPAEAVQLELDAYRSGWLGQMPMRATMSFFLQTMIFLTDVLWRTTGIMLIGMALFKWGVPTGQRSRAFYIRMALAGFLLGLPLVILGTVLNFQAGWSMEYSFFVGGEFNYWGGPLVSLGYMAVITLAAMTPACGWFTRPLAAVGRLAFTNYLLQTLICTTIFYGHGLGLFGSVERAPALLLVLGTWVVLIVFSRVYLKYFRYGPFEWLWRSLTYRQRQPIRYVQP
jgi:uncharacterized protein